MPSPNADFREMPVALPLRRIWCGPWLARRWCANETGWCPAEWWCDESDVDDLLRRGLPVEVDERERSVCVERFEDDLLRAGGRGGPVLVLVRVGEVGVMVERGRQACATPCRIT